MAGETIAPVQVLPLLTTVLADARNWGATPPAGTPSLVSLKDPGSQVVHPSALLEVHESVVPLGLAITRFGSAPVTGATSFTITGYQVNGATVDHESIQDDFAPAQFFDLSDDQKLARPSFERHDAGMRLTGVGLTTCGGPVSKAISYETFYIDQPGGALRTDPAVPTTTFGVGDLSWVLSIGASGRATIRTAGDRRYAVPGTPVRSCPDLRDRGSHQPGARRHRCGPRLDVQRRGGVLQAAIAQDPARCRSPDHCFSRTLDGLTWQTKRRRHNDRPLGPARPRVADHRPGRDQLRDSARDAERKQRHGEWTHCAIDRAGADHGAGCACGGANRSSRWRDRPSSRIICRWWSWRCPICRGCLPRRRR